MKEGILGNEGEEMENNDSKLGFWEAFDNVGGEGNEFGSQVNDERAHRRENNKRFDFDGEKSHDLLQRITDVESRCPTTGGSEIQGLKVDVNLNLGLGDEPSSSTSTAIAMGRENCLGDTQNKRPKVHSFSLDWGTSFENEIHYFAPVHEEIGDKVVPGSTIAGDDAGKNSDPLKMGDSLEVRMDLTDDLLHMVFSFLDHVDLCHAARVCKQWRDASSHEDFWRYLNFENRPISVQQFEDMCQRYPNAAAVNVYGTPAIHQVGMKAVSSLRNLEVLTLGKGQLGETFFQALTDCHMLRSLTVNDATLGNGIQEIPIYHDRLHELQIVKCRVLRVSIRCPQLETLSLKRSSMPHVVLNCPLLHELDIASCHKLSDAAIRSAATSCPLLESLDMSNCSCVSDETLREIAMSCGNLHVLDASYCQNISLEFIDISVFGSSAPEEHKACTLPQRISITSNALKVCNLFKYFVQSPAPICLYFPSVYVVKPGNKYSPKNVLAEIIFAKARKFDHVRIAMPLLGGSRPTECESLTNSICEVFSSTGGCPVLRSLVLDNCESLTAVSFCSTSLVNISLAGCRAITSVDVTCPYLERISLDGCDHLERATFSPVGLRSLNLGICPKLNVLHIEAPHMVSLELKGCGVLSEAFIECPLLTSLDASFCSQLTDDCLSAATSSCPLIESLVLMSCPSVGPDGLASLNCLRSLTYLDLSYTFLVNLQPIYDSCLYLKVLKLQACKYLCDTSLEPLYKGNALPALCELDLSYGTLCQSAIEELLACCRHLTHVSLNGCVNMHDLDWGSRIERLSVMSTFHGSHESSSLGNVIVPQFQANRLLQNLNCVGVSEIKKVVIPPTARCFHLSSLNLSLSSNLKEVDISCCNLLILNLSNCNSLEILKLDCTRLTSLFLQSCNINEEAMEAAIMGCNMLETLDIRFCPKISPLSMGTIRAACSLPKSTYRRFPEMERNVGSVVPKQNLWEIDLLINFLDLVCNNMKRVREEQNMIAQNSASFLFVGEKVTDNPADELVAAVNANRTASKSSSLYSNPGLACIALQYIKAFQGDCSVVGGPKAKRPADSEFAETFAPNCGVEVSTLAPITGRLLGCQSKYVKPSEAFSEILMKNEKSLEIVQSKNHSEVGAAVSGSDGGAPYFWCVLFSSGKSNSSFVPEGGVAKITRPGCFSGANDACSGAVALSRNLSLRLLQWLV
ncbi:F-box/LRR-repeat protein 15 [Sesamum angolense]|uniref:F-box/LRR-repeat protein 15 n=1 Tax=Sesamum angolense TaxID=2727404 RepID=A0AAE2BXM0_9LAMI|nr:F-box/LRR-repeat protein 15 [Sesamum angolense]